MINDEIIAAVDRWLATVVCSFFPGVLILDYIFGKGIFSSPPTTIYEFSLFLIHAAAISFLFVYIAQTGLERHFGGETTTALKSDQIGVVTVPLVTLLALTMIASYVCIENAAIRFALPSSHYARLVNSCAAFLITFVLSFPGNWFYFRWYKSTFMGNK